MAKVTVFGNVFDAAHNVIPASRSPELWLRPGEARAQPGVGLVGAEEIRATLTTTGSAAGEWTAQVERGDALSYTPILRYDQNTSDLANRGRGFMQFPAFYPMNGGHVSTLPTVVPNLRTIAYGFGRPPEWMEDILYFDLTGPKLKIWAPAGGMF